MKRVIIFALLCCVLLISCVPTQKEPLVIAEPEPTPAAEPILVIDPQGHSAMILDVLFTPDGSTLISVSNDKTIRLWDVATGDLIKTLRGQIGDGHEGRLFAGALSPDGNILAVGGYPYGAGSYGHPIQLFNLETGEQVDLLKGHTNVIDALAFSPDGRWLASGSGDHTVRIWDMENVPRTSKVRGASITLEGHTGDIYGVAFSPGGTKLVSASYDGTLRLWGLPQDLKGFENLSGLEYTEMKRHTAEVRCVAYAPNGKYIISGGKDHKILLWDGNGEFIKEIDELDNYVNTISFSADSKKLVAVSGMSPDRNAYVYSIPSGEKLITFTKHTNTVLASAFYGNDLIATAGGNDYDIYIWDAASGEVKTHIVGKGKPLWSVAFGEGLNVAFGNKVKSNWQENDYGILEKSFDFLDMSLNPNSPDESRFRRTQTEYQGKTLEKITNYELRITNGGTIKSDEWNYDKIRSYTFTKDGDVVVGSDFSLKLYNNDGSFVREFVGHTGVVWAVSVSEDGRILASASNDQTIRLWNIETGKCLATLFVASDNEWVCWTPQGYYAASAGGEKYIGWHINRGMDKEALFYPVSVFREQYHRPELVKRMIEIGNFEKALQQINVEAPPEAKILVRGDKGPALPPTFTWREPQKPAIETTEPSVHIKVNVKSDYKITDVKILVEGRPVATAKDIKPSGRDSDKYREIEYEVPLIEGRNGIAIFAENEYAQVTSGERVVLYTPPGSPWWKPDLYMVSIGIADYPLDTLKLNYTDDDARAMCHLFRKQEGKLFNNVVIKELYNQDATRVNIIDALEWLEQQTTQHDVAVIFVAAHGYNQEKKYYLLPVDGDPEKLRATAVDWKDFVEVLGNLPSRVLFFLDSCYSGQLGADVLAKVFRGGDTDNTEAIRELASDEYGVVILAASTGKETAVELKELQHGAFTQALLDGMDEGRADLTLDNIIYLRELDYYVAERVKELTQGQQHPTTLKPSTISRFPIVQVE